MQVFSSRQSMGVTSLPASRHLPVCISRAWNFPATLWPPWKGGGWEEVPTPHRLAHSTRQRLPWADVLPFPSRGEPVAGCLGTLEEGQGVSAMGPSLPMHSWTQGSRKPGLRWGAGELVIWPCACMYLLPWGSRGLTCWSMRFCVVPAFICPSQLEPQYSTNLSFVLFFGEKLSFILF